MNLSVLFKLDICICFSDRKWTSPPPPQKKILKKTNVPLFLYASKVPKLLTWICFPILTTIVWFVGPVQSKWQSSECTLFTLMVGVRPTKVKKFKITFAVLLLERSIKNKNILNINLNLHLFIILNFKLLCQGQSHLCTVYYVFF